MRLHGKITVNRYEDKWNPETTDIYDGYFEAQSIQAAKAMLTRKANTSELFSYLQSWDNGKRSYTGKELRWKPWSSINTYTQDNGKEVAFSTRMSDREFGETTYNTDYKYGKSVEYRVDITVRWLFQGGEDDAQ